MEKVEAQHGKQKLDRRKLMRAINRKHAELRECELQFATVKTSAEYDTLQTDIEELRSSIATRESELLTATQALDALRTGIRERRQQLTDLQTRYDASATLRRSKLAVLDAQLSELHSKRDVVIHSVDPKLLELYNRNRGRGGIRIAATRRGACGCCFQQLPPQNLNEARHATRPITCDHCSCLVVWDEHSQSKP